MLSFRGEPWHRLRQEDFGQVDLDSSPELLQLIQSMMRTDPVLRLDTHSICAHPIVTRARIAMERCYADAKANRTSVFAASPLAGVTESFLEDILGRPALDGSEMDVSA
jgi:mitosis inhibitor protein kinase SWE1